ncbi:hypothetical protein [Crocosphaera sp. XPORK-15E]|uniref:hypothetical protein n=1 Tax=Crocosphaera sp. XPORK-15E TaxID=3110247 RepID=UPI002B204B09|nr:hypothetical protein [Crocosphaera sp. XPORK-15E]
MKGLQKSSLMIFFLITGLPLTPAHSSSINPAIEVAQQTPSINREVRNFFETGRVNSQDRILFQRPPSGVIPVREQSNSWQFVIFKEGGVSFWMPPGILTQETVVLDTKLGEISFRTLASNAEDRRYIAAYAEGLTAEQIKDGEALLQAIRDKVTPENEFKLIRQRAITLDKYPGQELNFESENEMITFRIYLARNRIYTLGIRYPKSSPQTTTTRAFLNALELLQES